MNLAIRLNKRAAAARDAVIAKTPALIDWFAVSYLQIDSEADSGRNTASLNIPLELSLHAMLIESYLWSEGFEVTWTSGTSQLRVDW